MSWHFSQALVAEYSAAICSAGAPSAQSSGNHTPQAYLCSDRMTAFCRLSRFGMTFAPLTESLGAELLTWFLADSRARTSAALGGGLALMASGPASGVKWQESSVKYCLDSYSWKTHRCLWDEALPWSSVTLPRWGTTRTGVVYQHPTAERPISVTVSGLLPTCTATDYKGGRSPEAAVKVGRSETDSFRQFCRSKLGWKRPRPAAMEAMMLWPDGWSDLKPLATDRFREWQQQHGGF